jgi:predicted GH43/DUF377 family glycosyl hydrolase
MSIFRSPENPIIEPKDVKPSRDDFEVIGVFNAGVARFKDEVVLLLRVAERPISTHPDVVLTAIYDVGRDSFVIKEFLKDNPEVDFSDPRIIKTPAGLFLTSISHLRIARSKDGTSFEIEEAAAMSPANNYETFGIEDPRISLIGDTYYINYSAVSISGVTTYLASTRDFKSFKRHGIIFCPENKDVVILPEKVDGKYYALHRPASPLFKRHDIWLAESPDLICWGNHRSLMGPRQNCWDETRIGGGAMPFKIKQGWLEIYHGVNRNNRYCLGAILLGAAEPWKVIARSEKPIFEPQASYECKGFFGNVVFSCGLLYEEDKLKIYYGASDTSMCYAELPLEDVIRNLNL